MPTIELSHLNTVITDSMVGSTGINSPSATTIRVGKNSGVTYRGLIQFDLGLIPNNAIIDSAYLELDGTSDVGTFVNIHPITAAWNGFSTPYDADTFVNVRPSSGTSQLDVKSLLQKIVDGEYVNRGFLLKLSDEASDNAFSFKSMENTVSQRPKLVVSYTIPATGKKQVEFVGGSSSSGSTTNTIISLSLPAGRQVGDLLVAFVTHKDGVITSAPTGWVPVPIVGSTATNLQRSIYYRFVDESFAGDNLPPNAVMTFSGSKSTGWHTYTACFRNVKSVTDALGASVNSSTILNIPSKDFGKPNMLALLLELNSGGVSFLERIDFERKYMSAAGTGGLEIAFGTRYMHQETATGYISVKTGNSYQLAGVVLGLEPIDNNPPTLTLTNPSNNQTLSEGSSYPVEGSATDSDAGNVVTVKYQINNGPVRALQSGVSDGSTPISFAKSLTYRNKRIWDGSTDVIGVDLAENTDHILKVWAEDDQEGKSEEVTRAFRVLHNRPPVISGENGDLGILEVAPTVSYTVSDPEGNGFTVTEKLNGNVIRSFAGVANRQETLEVPFDSWLRLEPGVLHSLTIEATDSQGATSVRTYTLTRFEDEIEFEIETPWVTDVAAKRVLLTLDMTLPTGAELIAEACNNAFDTTPAWEDISFYARYGRGYVFQNTTKTAAQWGVSIRVRIRKGTATEPVVVKGFGGAFD